MTDKNFQGETIYHYFLDIGDEGFSYFQYLLNHSPGSSADEAMNLINANGDAPLHICAREGRDKFFFALINAGASLRFVFFRFRLEVITITPNFRKFIMPTF